MSEPQLSKDTPTGPLSESEKRDILENLLPGIGLDGAEDTSVFYARAPSRSRKNFSCARR